MKPKVSIRRGGAFMDKRGGKSVPGGHLIVRIVPLDMKDGKAVADLGEVLARAAHDFVESAGGGKEGA